MTQNIEFSLADLLAKIDNRLDKIESKIDYLSNEVAQIKVNVAKVDEKVGGLSKRLENLEVVSRTISGGIIVTFFVTLFVAIAKYLLPSLNI